MEVEQSFEAERNIVQTAGNLKKEGNDAYRTKDFRRAIGKYHRALLQLKSVESDKFSRELFKLTSTGDAHSETRPSSKELPPDLKQEKNQLLGECYNNLAACLLAKEGDINYERVIQYCENALELDPNNLKAIYRLGKAFFSLGKLEKAIAVLTSTPECKTATQIQELLQVVKQKDKLSTAGLKATYQRMFAPKPSECPKPQEELSSSNGHGEVSKVTLESELPKDGLQSTEKEY